MAKGGRISERGERDGGKLTDRDSIKEKKKMKKNFQRLGGKGGLSLESFANAKSRNDNYNPALIKKKKEFYRNAKYVQKYKRSLKQHMQPNVPSTSERRQMKDENQINGSNYVGHGTNEAANVNKNMKSRNNSSLKEMYEKKREEEEKARMEREAMIQAKKEAIQQTEARRKSLKGKMFKKTKSGQPVMKYRVEHILERIQGSSK